MSAPFATNISIPKRRHARETVLLEDVGHEGEIKAVRGECPTCELLVSTGDVGIVFCSLRPQHRVVLVALDYGVKYAKSGPRCAVSSSSPAKIPELCG